MILSLIAAQDRLGFIGKSGDIPWHLPADLRFFRERTWGKPVIVGRKTFCSIVRRIGRPLPSRYHIVMTTDEGRAREALLAGCDDISSTVEEAIRAAKRAACEMGEDEAFVIGGASIYEAFLEQDELDRMYITDVHADFGGDACFPRFDTDEWAEVWQEAHKPDIRNPHPYTFRRYDRRR